MDLTDIPGIGDKTARALELAGITTQRELLETYPRTYRQYRAATAASSRVGEYQVFKGYLTRPISKRTARVTTQISSFQDHTGRLTLRWFNSPFLSRTLSPDSLYLVKGRIEAFQGVKQLVSPSLTRITPTTPLENQLVPIYSQRGSLKPWMLRTKISAALNTKLPPDPLPSTIVTHYSLLSYHQALSFIHQPPSFSHLDQALHRLSFDELYQLQLANLLTKRSLHQTTPLKFNPKKLDHFLASLPFSLTNSQIQALDELTADLSSSSPMHRLLAGEVGSGKTVVAAAAAFLTHSAGFRTLVMAPTVILAEQLYESFRTFLSPHHLSIDLVTSGSKSTLNSDLVIGTQALLNRSFSHIGLVVIDEQHRFGVEQRNQLQQLGLHTLLMTATPIPRSLAQTLFGHLDLTRLTELPPGRLPVKTFVVPENKRGDAYTWLHSEIKKGNQVFMVTPLIETAEEQDLSPLKSLHALESTLKQQFPHLSIDIMHGRMKDTDKLAHIQAFRQGSTQILVATSMIEVGLDIPAANVMVIEDAERFGLATLHQLRGRVGRGEKQGYCLLFSNSPSRSTTERLQYFVTTLDGTKLALYDLQTRGPGELFGSEQHGFFRLKLANIYDEKLLETTLQAAKLTLSKSSSRHTITKP